MSASQARALPCAGATLRQRGGLFGGFVFALKLSYGFLCHVIASSNQAHRTGNCMSQLIQHDLRLANSSLGHIRWSSLAQRVLRMLLLWLALGALVGILTAPPGGWIGLLAGAVAGMIVLPVLGLVLAFSGGRWTETLLGATCGLISGVVLGPIVGSVPVGTSVSLCLILGGCAGATFPPLCRFKFWLAGRLTAQLPSAGSKPDGRGAVWMASPERAINP